MKRNSLALASLLAGIACFINLAGIEKAILAVTFGVLALGEIQKEPETKGKGKAYAGITLGVLYMVTIIVILAVKGPEILSYFRSVPK